jgi:hypothetical protein
MGNVEMRWLEYQEEEAIVPPASEIQFGKPFERGLVTKRKLQYRQKIDTTIRVGMFNDAAPNFEWSQWQDVPTITE